MISGDWLDDPAVQRTFRLLTDAGYQAYAVGGCVRNALLGEPVNDVDMTTDATPERVVELAKAAGIRSVPTGIDHGTVTLLLDNRSIEVTTFRKDVETDGRRAVVAFAETIEVDAHRRDFTINALYADAGGNIHDPLGALVDIDARRIRFIDDPAMRIQEDALRILRFFRFVAWYGTSGDGIDADGLAACAEHTALLDGLSAERIGDEIRKLLSAPDPTRAVAAMAASGVLSRVLPGAVSGGLGPLVHVEGHAKPRWHRRMVAIGARDTSRLRLSKADASALVSIASALEAARPTRETAYRHGADTAIDVALLTAAMSGAAPAADLDAVAHAGAELVFPVKARMLMPPLSPGPALGAALERLEAAWIASGFTLTCEELLSQAAGD